MMDSPPIIINRATAFRLFVAFIILYFGQWLATYEWISGIEAEVNKIKLEMDPIHKLNPNPAPQVNYGLNVTEHRLARAREATP